MNKLFTLYFTFAFWGLSYGQEYPERDKKFDIQIFKFLDVQTDQTPLETFLLNSKPFSKWDIRPLKRNKVWALDTIHTASEVPNFIWGAFANKYKIPQKDAMDFPNRLLNQGVDKNHSSINTLKANLEKFELLSNKIISSQNLFFVNQGRIQRIDEVYKEDNAYWKYIVPKESPFPISNKIDSTLITKFSNDQSEILNLLMELNIYAAVKTRKGIFYLIDGFTDNSYGFYFSETGEIEKDNFLFRIMKEEQINNKYFYYVAN